jgi:methanogenic corrinoid protein MtbC1
MDEERAPGRDERLAMLAALLDGDVPLAYRIATSLLAEGVPFDELSADILAPVQHEVGRRWAEGDLGVADEHAASAAVEELVVRLGTTTEPPSGPPVVVTTAEHDAHILGARVVASVLALDGFRVQFLGGSLPAPDLADFLDAHAPSALVLSCSMATAVASAARSIAAAHAYDVPVVAGGRALASEDRAARIGADAYAVAPRDVVGVLQRWRATPPRTLRGVPDPVPERESFQRRAPALIAAALAGVAPAGRERAFAAELDRLLQAVESALLVDDDQLLYDHVDWLRETGPAHGFARADVDAVLHEAARQMTGDLARAGAALGRALS